MRWRLHRWLAKHFGGRAGKGDAEFLGVDPGLPFEVHTARVAHRAGPDGGVTPQLILGLLQATSIPADGKDPSGPPMPFEGGCTIVADLRDLAVRYCVRKRLTSPTRRERQQAFAVTAFDSLRATYLGAEPLGEGDEPFAALHRGI